MLPNVSPGVCQENGGQTELLFTVSDGCSVDPLGSLHKMITITLLGWLLCQALFSAFFFFPPVLTHFILIKTSLISVIVMKKLRTREGK